jgi:hypothetical protein
MHEALKLMVSQLEPHVFKKYPVDEFLKMAINKLCEKRYSLKEVNVNKEALQSYLKDKKRCEVLGQLIDIAYCLKYNKFPLKSQPHDYIRNILDLKKYEQTCRNTETTYFYASPSILNFKIEITPENQHTVTFVSTTTNKTETFDLLFHPNYSYEALNNMSWYQRLDLCNQLQIKPKPMTVRELKRERIQCNKLPKGNINGPIHCYIRTEGFELGTFYVQTVSNCSNSRRLPVNRRHKTITVSDTLPANIDTFLEVDEHQEKSSKRTRADQDQDKHTKRTKHE